MHFVIIAHAKFTNKLDFTIYDWREYLTVELPIVKLDKPNVRFKTHTDLNHFTNAYSFQSVKSDEILCLVEANKNFQDGNYNKWMQCVKDLFSHKINCTSPVCATSLLTRDFPNIDSTVVEQDNFCITQGAEFYGHKYNIFYLKQSNQNIYALLSPYTLSRWTIILSCSCLLGLVLILTKFIYNPIIWLFSIVLEQGSTARNALNKANIFIVIIWLLAALLLRKSYTSNLYSYMTIDSKPIGLPRTFEETVDSKLVLLSTFVARNLLKCYTTAVFNASLQNKIYEVALQAIQNT